jgi:hypothetical protein
MTTPNVNVLNDESTIGQIKSFSQEVNAAVFSLDRQCQDIRSDLENYVTGEEYREMESKVNDFEESINKLDVDALKEIDTDEIAKISDHEERIDKLESSDLSQLEDHDLSDMQGSIDDHDTRIEALEKLDVDEINTEIEGLKEEMGKVDFDKLSDLEGMKRELDRLDFDALYNAPDEITSLERRLDEGDTAFDDIQERLKKVEQLREVTDDAKPVLDRLATLEAYLNKLERQNTEMQAQLTKLLEPVAVVSDPTLTEKQQVALMFLTKLLDALK